MLLETASTVTDGIDRYKRHRPLQMVSTVTNGIDCHKWHRLSQTVSTVTNGIDCHKWRRLLQTASTVTDDINNLSKGAWRCPSRSKKLTKICLTYKQKHKKRSR